MINNNQNEIVKLLIVTLFARREVPGVNKAGCCSTAFGDTNASIVAKLSSFQINTKKSRKKDW